MLTTLMRSKVTDKSLSEEIAGLAEAVRELRDREVAAELASLRAEVEKLRAERTSHHCHGCACMHIHYQYPITTTVTYPNTWTVGTGYVSTGTTTLSHVTTNAIN